jgi:2-oxoglutarate dehydrogenase E1 component
MNMANEMKSNQLTKEQREELEKFGANTWFVESLYEDYKENPDAIPEQWKIFFGDDDENGSGKSISSAKSSFFSSFKDTSLPSPEEDEETQLIAGSAAKILDNMTNSLTVPVATSQRTIPVKLLEENRILINQELKKKQSGKISFTHIIAWAIVKALFAYPTLNYAFTIKNGKPLVIKRKSINLGIAIDIEKKDGSRSLIVPNIKDAGNLNFYDFWLKYEDLIQRTRTGQIDPIVFLGASITLTNPGTLGTNASIPRLMVGQGAIIATGAIQYPAEYLAMSPSTISALGVSKVMTITSTYDHRIIQGAESGLFLKKVNELLLGEDNFYDEIFSALKIPFQPLKWKTDYLPGGFNGASKTEEIEKQARILQLINMYRVRGHLIANLDPLGSQNIHHPELDPAIYNLTIWDYDREFIAGGYSGIKTATLREILDMLMKTYCGKIGVEYMHIQNPEEKAWFQSIMEPVKNTPDFNDSIRKNILNKLIIAETFEHFTHNKFVGHKRFSLEGSETLIPVLDFILNEASEKDIPEIVFGMAHRGRLNVLANILGKSYESIFSEFEDIQDPNSIEGSGDVKYHLGASGTYKTVREKKISVSIASNPSHLEWVNPVVEGIVRAKQTRMGDSKENRRIIPLLIHGDAAFAGQGIVAETLNLSQLSGYRTGGTIHIIINNQIGFTTDPTDARSSVYCTDVAKMIQSPIFHVNGDDPESALWAAKLALEYRQKFHKDVVIDLIGYRRHGHNEGDEPGFTQPLLYEKIKSHPSVRKIYEDKLVSEGIVDEEETALMSKQVSDLLARAFNEVKKKSIEFGSETPLAVPKERMEAIRPIEDTAISEKELKIIIEGLTRIPDNFTIHPKLKKFLDKRKELLDDNGQADWALAEALAFGSLLYEGTPVRLSGQDSVRGTFSQRHLAFTDIKTGVDYLPLSNISENQARFEALDSLLSEAAVLGFEYGYSTADPLALVLWEAQFGDFANSAQVIIDNFIVASYEKWKVSNSVVMLLPHGFEGQGPEHSSGRLERFLILCAENNMQVCNLTTPAQYFHLLRRQVKHAERKPLVIMTPKSLLRHPEARSVKYDFTHGRFKEVIDDELIGKKKFIEKVIITSGKVYYDLIKYRKEHGIDETAIVRLEQFYPFKSEQVKEILSSYTNAKKVVWVQEEPKNMGTWNFLSNRLNEDLQPHQKLLYAGRPESASPAVGSAKISNRQQIELIVNAFSC